MSTEHIDPNAFLLGNGIPSAKFPNQAFGTTVTGTICAEPEVTQQTDLDSGELKFFADSGKPMMMLVITVQTDERDPEIPDDDGKRKFYVRAKMQDAVKNAVKASGGKLGIGGVLSITYTGDDAVKKRGHNPPKIYSATYTPPSTAAANAFLSPPAPVQAAPFTPPPGMSAEQAAAFAALTPEQRAQLLPQA
ncbi:hypothetical protein ACQPYK_08670 [Streptosporangium sp. CA-135522]|uniref:hypothetical protein n=1 Tax=Streptosporangium sp. CA-135522 TaxID=3240072 RepID=UPI003D8FA2FC